MKSSLNQYHPFRAATSKSYSVRSAAPAAGERLHPSHEQHGGAERPLLRLSLRARLIIIAVAAACLLLLYYSVEQMFTPDNEGKRLRWDGTYVDAS